MHNEKKKMDFFNNFPPPQQINCRCNVVLLPRLEVTAAGKLQKKKKS
jgi:hypothetical protein